MAQHTDITEEHLAELMHCIKDPAYFIEKYALPALDYYKAPVKLTDHQRRWIQQLLGKNANSSLEMVDRQTYGTTTMLAIAAWVLIFEPCKVVLYGAHNQLSAMAGRSALDTMLRELPFFMRPTLQTNTRHSIRGENGAECKFVVMSRNSGRGMTVNYALFDQVAAFSEDAIEAIQNITATLSVGCGKTLSVVNTNVPNKYNGWMRAYAHPGIAVYYVNGVR